jgi:hypothetical protein
MVVLLGWRSLIVRLGLFYVGSARLAAQCTNLVDLHPFVKGRFCQTELYES